MGVVQFHTFDNAGNETGVKAELLLAALDVPNGALYVQMSPGKWVNLKVPSTMSIRTFAVHHNPSSNVEKLYVGNGINGYGKGSIYSGTYDPTSSSIIQWDSMPLISGLPDRVMSMVNCDGMFFAADKPSIYRYHDQTNTFDVLYSFPLINAWDKSKYTSGFRALTCIDDPAQPGKKMLLTGFEGVQGDIFLIDPITGAAQVELDTRQLLQLKWGEAVASSVRDIIPGYSRMLSVTTEAGATKLIGLQAQQGVLNDNVIQGEKFSAWFLSCAQGGCDPGDAPNFNQRPYRLHQVPAPLSWPYLRSDKELWSIRTIAVSPFPEDQGQVLYLGGYDGHFAPGHNTAWLYRVGVDTALGAGAAPPNGGP